MASWLLSNLDPARAASDLPIDKPLASTTEKQRMQRKEWFPNDWQSLKFLER